MNACKGTEVARRRLKVSLRWGVCKSVYGHVCKSVGVAICKSGVSFGDEMEKGTMNGRSAVCIPVKNGRKHVKVAIGDLTLSDVMSDTKGWVERFSQWYNEATVATMVADGAINWLVNEGRGRVKRKDAKAFYEKHVRRAIDEYVGECFDVQNVRDV